VKTVRSLGLRAHQLRSEAGLTQEQLAAAAFVSRKWLTEFENGKPTVETSKVLDVFQALGYEIELQPLPKPEPGR
jgi:transcriptional regulator with XRE-family HTH domain